jgi:hypothetical protein
MANPVLVVFAFWPEIVWIIPCAGFVVACFAFVFGKRLVSRSPGEDTQAQRPKAPQVDVFVHGNTSDRRLAPRRKGNSIEVVLTRGPETLAINGWVTNRSVGGLCLLLDAAVEEGEVLEVRPRTAPESIPWTKVDIRSCRPLNGDWEVGCRFVHSPPYNVLLLFG